MQTAHQLMIRDALISARERFRLMIEQYNNFMDNDGFALWAELEATKGLEEADKALSTVEPNDAGQR